MAYEPQLGNNTPTDRNRLRTILGSAALVLIVAAIIGYVSPSREGSSSGSDTPHTLPNGAAPGEDLPDPPAISPAEIYPVDSPDEQSEPDED